MTATVQPFPSDGVLSTNLNLTKSALAAGIGKAGETAYSYIVRTVGIDRRTLQFEQHGSAPNFQGGYITLCTCKHQMRASLDCSEWPGKWIAGFTSRCRYQGRHWLLYLTQIEEAHDSHADLWACLPATVREAKSAEGNFLGDLFRPRGRVAGEGRFDPHRYYTPLRHSHRRNSCDNGWHNDIDYEYSDRCGRPALLVGDPHRTFLWREPVLFIDDDHCRNYLKWESVAELLRHLRSEGL